MTWSLLHIRWTGALPGTGPERGTRENLEHGDQLKNNETSTALNKKRVFFFFKKQSKGRVYDILQCKLHQDFVTTWIFVTKESGWGVVFKMISFISDIAEDDRSDIKYQYFTLVHRQLKERLQYIVHSQEWLQKRHHGHKFGQNIDCPFCLEGELACSHDIYQALGRSIKVAEESWMEEQEAQCLADSRCLPPAMT